MHVCIVCRVCRECVEGKKGKKRRGKNEETHQWLARLDSFNTVCRR